MFVPVSATLLLVVVPPFFAEIDWFATASPRVEFAVYGLLGVASYGFPFLAVRRLVTRMALQTLKEFASIADKEHLTEATAFAAERRNERS